MWKRSELYRNDSRQSDENRSDGMDIIKGLLTNRKERENVIGGYLDSGANAHTKDVFVEFQNKQTNIFTACSNSTDKNTNQASVGKLKALTYNTGGNMINETEKGIYCKDVVENLISVGKMCDSNQIVVFDKYGYGIYEGEVSVEGIEVHAQNRHPLPGLPFFPHY